MDDCPLPLEILDHIGRQDPVAWCKLRAASRDYWKLTESLPRHVYTDPWLEVRLPPHEYDRWTRFSLLGKQHRDGDKPAAVNESGSMLWYQHGVPHRDGDKPARIWKSHPAVRYWCKHGKPWREGGKPTEVYDDGSKVWMGEDGEEICHYWSKKRRTELRYTSSFSDSHPSVSDDEEWLNENTWAWE